MQGHSKTINTRRLQSVCNPVGCGSQSVQAMMLVQTCAGPLCTMTVLK